MVGFCDLVGTGIVPVSKKTAVNKLMEVWCAKIELKMQKIQKTALKQDFLKIFSILTVFRTFLNSGSILAQKLNSFFVKKNLIFDTPGTPGGASI
jgi:hypothetical protein